MCRTFRSSGIAGSSLGADWLSRPKFLFQGPVNRFGYKTADFAAQPGDFLDDPGAEKGIGLLGHHEEGLDPLVELAIHEGQLELELEIGHSPEAAEDRVTAALFDVVNEQSFEGLDLDTGHKGHGLFDQAASLFEGKERRF
jgi:hypothetical protein